MFEEVDAAVTVRLDTQWALLHSDIKILYDNMETSETDLSEGETHLEVIILDDESERMSLGNENRLHRYPGFININILVSKGAGVRYAKSLADEVATIFRDQQFSGVLCRSPSIIRIGPSGGWFQYTVSVPFQYDEQFST